MFPHPSPSARLSLLLHQMLFSPSLTHGHFESLQSINPLAQLINSYYGLRLISYCSFSSSSLSVSLVLQCFYVQFDNLLTLTYENLFSLSSAIRLLRLCSGAIKSTQLKRQSSPIKKLKFPVPNNINSPVSVPTFFPLPPSLTFSLYRSLFLNPVFGNWDRLLPPYKRILRPCPVVPLNATTFNNTDCSVYARTFSTIFRFSENLS